MVENLVTMHGGDGAWMLGFETGPYERQSSWTGISARDVWLINTDSGQKTIVAKNLSNTVVLSPFGKYVVYYVPADSSWHSYNTVTEKTVNLISGIRAGFYDEENDVPKLPDSYGIAGFSKDDEYVLLYDRYDIWSVDPSGLKNPFCLTSRYGRQNKLRLRYVKLDKDEYFISLKQPLYLSTFNERTMQTWLCLSLSRRSYHPKSSCWNRRMPIRIWRKPKTARCSFSGKEISGIIRIFMSPMTDSDHLPGCRKLIRRQKNIFGERPDW